MRGQQPKTLGALGVALLAVLAGSGCTSNPPVPPSSEETRLQRALLESSQQVAASIRLLAEMRNAELTQDMGEEQMAQARLAATRLPAGLDKPISLDYHGEVKLALDLVNQLTGFGEVRVYGTPPTSGATVKIKASSRVAYDVIRDMGTYLARRAEIRIIEPNQGEQGVIELHYRAPSAHTEPYPR